MSDLLRPAQQGLFCPDGAFHIDPEEPVPVAVITHAHADHARPGSERYICAQAGVSILRKRLGDVEIQGVPYGEQVSIGDVGVSFHPAGHVLGSSQVRVEGKETWVVSGDYKRAADPSCAPFEVVPCDVFVTEATFGLPVFRWPSTASVMAELLTWWDANAAAGKPSVLLTYSLGKSQRVLAELADSGREVFVHGAVHKLTELYREAGVAMAPTRYVGDEPADTDYSRALVLAPPGAHGTKWIRRFKNAELGMASGWMRLRGPRRRRALSKGLVLSDHADWNALLRTVEEVGARRVLVTHGYVDPLVAYLREQGVDAGPLAAGWLGDEAQ